MLLGAFAKDIQERNSKKSKSSLQGGGDKIPHSNFVSCYTIIQICLVSLVRCFILALTYLMRNKVCSS